MAANAPRKYQNKRRPAAPAVEQQVIEGILKALWWLVTLPFKRRGGAGTARRGNGLSSETARELAAFWHTTISDRSGKGSDLSPAVMEADKMLDLALKDMQLAGTTMGERLRLAEPLFSPDLYQRLWIAHKMRNHLAHEVGAYIHANEARAALTTFQEALRTLGVLI